MMRRLFPPPTYEPPNDVFSEVTGLLQVVPAAVTAYFLYRLFRSGRASCGARRKAGECGMISTSRKERTRARVVVDDLARSGVGGLDGAGRSGFKTRRARNRYIEGSWKPRSPTSPPHPPLARRALSLPSRRSPGLQPRASI